MKIAPARDAVGFRNILFATDFSFAAAHAIPYVKRIAKRYDANLVALHVRPPAVDPMAQPAYWPDEETIRKENEGYQAQLLETFAGISTTPLIEEGDIQSHLQAAIAKNDTELVVIGTRGRTGLGKLLLGSVAEEIFRTVDCPVLTVGRLWKPRVAQMGKSGKFFTRPTSLRLRPLLRLMPYLLRRNFRHASFCSTSSPSRRPESSSPRTTPSQHAQISCGSWFQRKRTLGANPNSWSSAAIPPIGF